MCSSTSNQLAKYARHQVGDALRSVAVLHENDCEAVYIRNDLKAQYDPEQYKRVATTYQTEFVDEIHGNEDTPIGEKRTTIHYHENAFVFQFPHEDCHSILLSVEPDVGSRLQSFIEGCRERL